MTARFESTRKEGYFYVSDKARKAIAGFLGEASNNIPLTSKGQKMPSDITQRTQDLMNLFSIAIGSGGYATKIINHDVHSRLSLIGLYLSERWPEEKNYFRSSLLALRAIGKSIAYLELEDPTILSTLEKSAVLFSLSQELNQTRAKTKTINLETEIDEADYFTFLQLIKNARYYEGDLRLSANAKNGHESLVLCDSGMGIVDKDRKPLEVERFLDLFRDYSTSGGGLGLQLVHRLTHLRNGFIEVQTKRAGETKVTVYNSKRGTISEAESIDRFPKEYTSGTQFAIYLPSRQGEQT